MDRWSMKCKKCGSDLGAISKAVASICLRPREDEETRSYFLCRKCNVYTVWVYIEEFFTDKETMFATGPVAREEGDSIVAKIRKCPAPQLVSRRCPTHEELSSRLA